MNQISTGCEPPLSSPDEPPNKAEIAAAHNEARRLSAETSAAYAAYLQTGVAADGPLAEARTKLAACSEAAVAFRACLGKVKDFNDRQKQIGGRARIYNANSGGVAASTFSVELVAFDGAQQGQTTIRSAVEHIRLHGGRWLPKDKQVAAP